MRLCAITRTCAVPSRSMEKHGTQLRAESLFRVLEVSKTNTCSFSSFLFHSAANQGVEVDGMENKYKILST